jgi:hypothetical protein
MQNRRAPQEFLYHLPMRSGSKKSDSGNENMNKKSRTTPIRFQVADLFRRAHRAMVPL